MALTTTTLAAIVASYTAKLRAITPATLADKKFDRCPPVEELRMFALRNGGSACLRKFEFLETGSIPDPPLLDPSAVLRRREVTLSIAYPAELRTLFGIGQRVDIESAIESDARQVRDVLFSPGNYLSGQGAAFVDRMPLQRDGRVWFQDFLFTAEHYESQSLT